MRKSAHSCTEATNASTRGLQLTQLAFLPISDPNELLRELNDNASLGGANPGWAEDDGPQGDDDDSDSDDEERAGSGSRRKRNAQWGMDDIDGGSVGRSRW